MHRYYCGTMSRSVRSCRSALLVQMMQIPENWSVCDLCSDDLTWLTCTMLKWQHDTMLQVGLTRRPVWTREEVRTHTEGRTLSIARIRDDLGYEPMWVGLYPFCSFLSKCYAFFCYAFVLFHVPPNYARYLHYAPQNVQVRLLLRRKSPIMLLYAR